MDDDLKSLEGRVEALEDELLESKMSKLFENNGVSRGEKAYGMRVGGSSWKDIQGVVGYNGLNLAKGYARSNKMEWPIKLDK